MRFHNWLAGGLAAVALSAPAVATTPNAVSYLCGGVGENSRAEAEAFPHSLKLVFAQPDGHFLADVSTRITDANGDEVVNTTCSGPWLLTDLPDGQYQVEATFNGQSKTISVSVDGPAQQETLITF